MSIAFSRAASLPICRCRTRPNSSWFKALGIELPLPLLMRVDEVIE
jgi:hypothetical protein